jgi:hypothetical protein
VVRRRIVGDVGTSGALVALAFARRRRALRAVADCARHAHLLWVRHVAEGAERARRALCVVDLEPEVRRVAGSSPQAPQIHSKTKLI